MFHWLRTPPPKVRPPLAGSAHPPSYRLDEETGERPHLHQDIGIYVLLQRVTQGVTRPGALEPGEELPRVAMGTEDPWGTEHRG